MDIIKLMKERHSVRQYEKKPIEEEKRQVLNELTRELNEKSGLNIQIIYDEPKCFKSIMAHFGNFKGVENYIAIVGKKGKDLHEKSGYYGEQLVLKAQELGLNTCWVALTKGKTKAVIKEGEKLAIVISLGYGQTNGVSHVDKPMESLYKSDVKEIPQWFARGLEAAMLAPTAINQQKFLISLKEDSVTIESKGGPYANVDLGIVKYHFEAASGKITIN